jgi:pilus assembly protein CpaB
MIRKPKGILPAVALALAGTLLLVGYVRAAEGRASAGEDLVPVLVVNDTIPAGTSAADVASHVTTQKVPVRVRTSGAVTTLSGLRGMVAAVDLLPGEQLTSSRFVAPNDLGRAAVPKGLLEVTVSLDPVRALGGQLTPGQLVAVLASTDDGSGGIGKTELILHDVKVTRVQSTEPTPQKDGRPDPTAAPTGTMLITLALDAPSVERVVFAAEHGRLWLSAESSDSASGATVR